METQKFKTLTEAFTANMAHFANLSENKLSDGSINWDYVDSDMAIKYLTIMDGEQYCELFDKTADKIDAAAKEAKYTVQKKWRTLDENGKPQGGWQYHDLFKTADQGQAYDFLAECPEDRKWEFYQLSTRRPQIRNNV